MTKIVEIERLDDWLYLCLASDQKRTSDSHYVFHLVHSQNGSLKIEKRKGKKSNPVQRKLRKFHTLFIKLLVKKYFIQQVKYA